MRIIPEHFWEILFYDEWKSELEEQLFSKVGKDSVENYFMANIQQHFSLFEEQIKKQVATDLEKAIDDKISNGRGAIPKVDIKEERLKRAEETLQKHEGVFASIESGQKDILSAYRTAEEKIAVISDDYRKIQQKYKEQTEQIDFQKELIDRQQQDIKELHKLVADLKCQLNNISIQVGDDTSPALEQVTDIPPTVPEKRVIDSFILQQTQQVLFPADVDVINTHIAFAEDCNELVDTLKKSAIENRDLFIRVIEKYEKELEKLKTKLTFSDEDYISLETTEKFAKVVERNLISILCPAIYEGMKTEPEPYYNVLNALNRYLQKCNFYTGIVNLGVSISEQQELLEFMTIIPKNTDKPAEDNTIAEVRMLPYFLNYIDEDKEIEKYCIEGQMVVNKFKA